MSEKIEKWKSLDFLGYSDYEVSNFGNVKSLNYKRTGEEKILKPSKRQDGYLHVGLYENGKQKFFQVHRLVALAFIPNDNPIEKTEINHLDENKHNNNVSNLCWCSHIENINYGSRIERIRKKLKGHKVLEETKQKIVEAIKKPILQFSLSCEFIKEFDSAKSASIELNIDSSAITKVCKGRLKSAYGFIWRYKE